MSALLRFRIGPPVALIGLAALFCLVRPVAARTIEPPPLLRGVHQIRTMGASITQFAGRPGGYVWLLQQYLRVLYPEAGIQVVDVGVSGNTSHDMVARFKRDVVDAHPDLVTIKAGFNDLWRKFGGNHPRGDGPGGASAEQYGQNVRAMAAMAREAGIRVVLMTPTFFEEPADSIHNVKLQDYVDVVRKLARDEHYQLADQSAALRKAYNGSPLRLTTDGVHMTPAGDAVMARTLLLGLGISAEALDSAGPAVQQALIAGEPAVPRRSPLVAPHFVAPHSTTPNP